MSVLSHLLLGRRRFLPLFIAQFCGVAHDNVFKNAVALLMVYRIGGDLPVPPHVLVTLAAGIFILPYFLFSATAGQVADRFEKSGLIRWVKGAEVALAGLGAAALLAANAWGMLVALFLFGVQATFFGPLKYAILPEALPEEELVGGNALVEGGTFVAILIGTIVSGLLILTEHGPQSVAVLMVALALAGYGASLWIPVAGHPNPTVRISANLVAETRSVLAQVNQRRDIRLAVLGTSWFWLMGATYLAQFPAFAKDALGAGQQVVTLLLTVFSVGIGVGSVLCGRLLHGKVSARFVPYAALGMAVFSLDLYVAALAVPPPMGEGLTSLAGFLSASVANWRVLFDFLMIALCGGFYIVPLYTIIQQRSAEDARARAVAAMNISNALFMVISAVVSAALLAGGLSVVQVFLVQAVGNLAIAAKALSERKLAAT